LVVVEREL
jgi:hypothetical protein